MMDSLTELFSRLSISSATTSPNSTHDQDLAGARTGQQRSDLRVTALQVRAATDVYGASPLTTVVHYQALPNEIIFIILDVYIKEFDGYNILLKPLFLINRACCAEARRLVGKHCVFYEEVWTSGKPKIYANYESEMLTIPLFFRTLVQYVDVRLCHVDWQLVSGQTVFTVANTEVYTSLLQKRLALLLECLPQLKAVCLIANLDEHEVDIPLSPRMRSLARMILYSMLKAAREVFGIHARRILPGVDGQQGAWLIVPPIGGQQTNSGKAGWKDLGHFVLSLKETSGIQVKVEIPKT